MTFTHDGAGEDALFDDFTLTIAPGEKIGLVGHSGPGKTTLTRLLLRFSDVDSGAIRIDGQDLREVTQASLRRSIAYVAQEPLLFHRSIADNIAYGRPGATPQEVHEAAVKASADEFIARLPTGYDTTVGERGVKLSGGQRQRIAIARAVLKDANLLVLDEATSALDSESEVHIQAALAEAMKGRTTIVIAHRLSTVQAMDRIVVLADGRIVEQGSHAELLGGRGCLRRPLGPPVRRLPRVGRRRARLPAGFGDAGGGLGVQAQGDQRDVVAAEVVGALAHGGQHLGDHLGGLVARLGGRAQVGVQVVVAQLLAGQVAALQDPVGERQQHVGGVEVRGAHGPRAAQPADHRTGRAQAHDRAVGPDDPGCGMPGVDPLDLAGAGVGDQDGGGGEPPGLVGEGIARPVQDLRRDPGRPRGPA